MRNRRAKNASVEQCWVLPPDVHRPTAPRWLLLVALTVACAFPSAELPGAPSESAATTQPAPTSLRLAIVSGSPESLEPADLLTVQLSTNAQVQLLEREQIRKIQQEQSLGAAGAHYLNLGRTLGAEALIVLDTERPGTDLTLRFRLIAVRPGVIVHAQGAALPLEKPMQWSTNIVECVSRFIPKLKLDPKQALPLSIVNFRSALGSEESRELEKELALLATERLSREPRVFVLERRKLHLLTDEKDLDVFEDSAFWSGSHLLEGTIDPEGYSPDRMTIRVRLVPPRNGTPVSFAVNCTRGDLCEAVNQLAAKTLAALNTTSTVEPWNAADEANRFLTEAVWAHRWRLYPQAQAASESAWALGHRTREVAELRVRAYAEAYPIDDGNANIQILAVPDPALLEPATRALELYARATSLLFTNDAPIDRTWFAAGLRALRPAACLLDAFFHTAELRAGNEEKLADLRSATREAVGLMQARMDPSWRSESVQGTRVPDRRWFDTNRRNITQVVNKFEQVVWSQAGVWHERAEDSLPTLRRMVEQGYAPRRVPRITGWTAQERNRAPQALRKLVQDLCASTNRQVYVAGLLLDLAQTAYHPHDRFVERETKLLNTLADNQDWLLSGWEPVSLLTATGMVLADKYPQYSGDFRHEQFAVLRHELRKRFLLRYPDFNPPVFEALFTTVYPELATQAEARELIAIIDPVCRTNRWLASGIGKIRAKAALPATNAVVADARPSAPAAKPLPIAFVSWKRSTQTVLGQFTPEVQALIVRNGQLCARVLFRERGRAFDFPSSYLMISPVSGELLEIPFPEKMGYPGSSFEVTRDSLFVMMANQLCEYNFSRKAWQSSAIPVEDPSAKLLLAGNRLFVSGGKTILEVSLATKQVRIVASARRSPPVNEMDTLLDKEYHQFFPAGEKLGLRLGPRQQLFLYSPDTDKWSPLPGLPRLFLEEVRPFYSDCGVQFLCRGQYVCSRFLAVWYDAPNPELLLEGRWVFRNPEPGGQQLGSPRWTWPEPYKAERSCVISESRSLFLLAPRFIAFPFRPSEEPVAFKDDRHATLLAFTPEMKEAAIMPIRFEKEGKPADPFDPKVANFPFNTEPLPFWVAAPEGFGLVCPGLEGHWLIPNSALPWRSRSSPGATEKSQSQPAGSIGANRQ